MLVRWLHLIAAATWTGGLITLGALVPAMRNAGVERSQLQAVARQFGRVSWTAMVVAIATGVIQLLDLDVDMSFRTDFGQRLFLKLILVAIAISLALVHQFTARTSTPRMRGIIQAATLLVSLAIFGAAVAL